VRSFKDLTFSEESKWQDLKDFNEEKLEGFGVKVDWFKDKLIMKYFQTKNDLTW
tara:strand:+ start:114 stop:275 length:162 start_codon:yes stop_codon:yes gene_type:complete